MASLRLPWMNVVIPLLVHEEIVKCGACPYCLLRFITCRDERLYSEYESTIIETMFPSSLLESCDGDEEDLVKRKMTLQGMKQTQLERKVCTVCLDTLPPNKAFFGYIAQCLRAADYEFDEFCMFKTVPSSLVIRQYGLWVHLKETFPLVAFFTSGTPEGQIIELKEAMRRSHSRHIQDYVNILRSIDNGTDKEHTVTTVFSQDSKEYNVDVLDASSPFAEIPSPDVYPHVSRHEINKKPAELITNGTTTAFKVYTVYLTEQPEYEDALRHALMDLKDTDKGKKKHGNNNNSGNTPSDVLGVNVLIRNAAKLPSTLLRDLGIVPPRLPSYTVDMTLATGRALVSNDKRGKLSVLHKASKAAQRALYNSKNDDGKELSVLDLAMKKEPYQFTPFPLQGTPLGIMAAIDSTNGVPPGTMLQLSPFVTVEVCFYHDNVLIQGNYLKTSRNVSHTSWYEASKVDQALAIIDANAAALLNNNNSNASVGETTENSTENTDSANAMTDVISSVLNANEKRTKKRHEDFEDSEDEQDAAVKLDAEYEEQGVFANTSVEAEMSYRVCPYFWPGKGKGYESLLNSHGSSYSTALDKTVTAYELQRTCEYKYKFHSSGREDLDVRMLGGGRPFFLELVDPHRVPKMTPEFIASLEKEINLHTEVVRIVNLEPGSQESFQAMVKGIAEKAKRYRCVVYSDKALTKEQVETLNGQSFTIVQLTPLRVIFRRVAMARNRWIKDLQTTYLHPHWFILDMTTQAGAYIKEFVHSDRGRTTPSVSEMLDAKCTIIQLDVTDLIM